MAKDKTRERNLPAWLKQRSSMTIKTLEATRSYYQTDLNFLSWHDTYGAFRQGARVRES